MRLQALDVLLTFGAVLAWLDLGRFRGSLSAVNLLSWGESVADMCGWLARCSPLLRAFVRPLPRGAGAGGEEPGPIQFDLIKSDLNSI